MFLLVRSDESSVRHHPNKTIKIGFKEETEKVENKNGDDDGDKGSRDSDDGKGEQGQGLFTTESVEAGELLFSIPAERILTEEVVLASEVGRTISGDADCAVVPARIVLNLFLIAMRHRTSGEPCGGWDVYAKSLPEASRGGAHLDGRGR